MTLPLALVACILCTVLVQACAGAGLTLAVPGPRDLSRGMWVWSSAALLDDPVAQKALFAFSRTHGIGSLWMQVTTARLGGDTLDVSRAAAWRALLTAAHAEGFTVEALDGDPTYADRAFHGVPLAVTDAVLAFNRGGRADQRFDGLRFDTELYLLPAWHNRATRERLLADYLTLNDEIQRRIRQARPMTYAVDLPVWWSATDPMTGEAVAAVTYGGVRRSAAAHALERLDSVTVMNYRNQAAGPDGLVALATPVLVEGQRISSARLRVGVETSRFRESRVWFVIGPLIMQIDATLGRTWTSDDPGGGFQLRTFDDGQRIHLGVGVAEGAGPPPPTLVDIARQFAPRPQEADLPEIAAALRAFDRSAEWRDARAAPILDPRTGATYAGVTATSVPLPKLTFAGRPDAMEDELRAAERAFRQFEAYQGLAVHDYDAFRALARDAPGASR